MQLAMNEPKEHMARATTPKSVRYLYIVARGGSAQSSDIFSAMRRDMSHAAVELMYDRRLTERRSLPASVEHDRRASDRRRQDAGQEMSRAGWARVRVD